MTDNQLAINKMPQIEALAQNEKVIGQFMQVLGSKRQALSYIYSALLAVSNSKELMECEPATVWSSALRIATLRLSCEPSLAQAHLVPFKNWKTGKMEATVILGWRGIKQIAMRTNKYRFINSRELYEGQVWTEDTLTGETKILGQRTTDQVIGYFNFFELYSGYSHGLYMTIAELEYHGKRYSKTYDYTDRNGNLTSKWRTDFPYMALKTVTRLNLLRNGYMNPEDAAILDAMGEDAGEGDVIDTTFKDVDPNEKTAEQPKEKHTEKQNLNDLGFDADEKKPTQEVKAEPAQEEKTLLETAEAIPADPAPAKREPTEAEKKASQILFGHDLLGDLSPDALKKIMDNDKIAGSLRKSAATWLAYVVS